MSEMSRMISNLPLKYNDPRNPIVTIEINGDIFPNTLIDLGATINTMDLKL